MRRFVPPVFLALLAACTVTTTGAPCTSDLNCPSDQGCGSNGACSVEALSCPGHTTAGQCSPGTSCVSGEVVTCTAGSGVCSTRTTRPCDDPGMTCTSSGGVVACACPAADACTQLDATRCSPAGDAIQRCRPVVTGSACLSWQVEQGCAAAGLVCSASACVCPANPGPTFVADAVGGSPAGSAPQPTGLLTPTACRYLTLTEALAAANLRGAGSTALAAGWSPVAPGGTVVFSEPGGLSVGAGVTLATDDAVPTVGHYAVTTPAALTGPLVELGPGGVIAGFELRNAASSGEGVRTLCPTSADTSPASITAVRVAAASGGTPAVRLATGVAVAGFCGATLTDVSVDGAGTGILVDAVAPAVESTASAPRISGSTLAGVTVIEGKLTVSGGAIDANAAGVLVGTSGTGAPSFSATGTAFRGNAGDAIYVARGTLTTDACPFADNGTHVHAQPTGGAALGVSVRNSAGLARTTGASNSAFRLLAMGAASTLELTGNEVVGNDASQSYNMATGLRRGGGIVLTAPFAGSTVIRGNLFYGNRWDQVLVAASGPDAIVLSGTPDCGITANTFSCYDASNGGVGLYSNGAAVQASWNHWTRQPAVISVDVAGSGITGFDTSACPVATVVCP